MYISMESAVKKEGNSLLFEYGLKCLLWAGFLELVLYRLVSRLGMHLAKLAEKYEFVRITFKTLSSLGFVLLNVTSILLFLIVFIVLIQKSRNGIWKGKLDFLLVPSVSVLVLLIIAYLLFPPTMLGSILYNGISLFVLMVLTVEFMMTHHVWGQRLAVGSFVLGICGWISSSGVRAGSSGGISCTVDSCSLMTFGSSIISTLSYLASPNMGATEGE